MTEKSCVNGIKTEEVPEELKVLEIPGEIDGKKVTSIASGNFNLRGLFIEEIVIPDTVERIEEFAFAYMVSLHEIIIQTVLNTLERALLLPHP